MKVRRALDMLLHSSRDASSQQSNSKATAWFVLMRQFPYSGEHKKPPKEVYFAAKALISQKYGLVV